MKSATIILLALLFWPAAAEAQIEWRVSVKFILDANGNRSATGNLNTDTEVQGQVDLGNAALDATGRGYRLKLVEIVDLTGLGAIASIGCSTPDRDGLDLAARTYPAVYAWRSDAINVYVTQASCAGICSFPSGSQETIVLGQSANPTSLLHEVGHYMGLCHTQGCECGACGTDPGLCNDYAGDDGIGDTLPDLGCWSQDEIAVEAFSQVYANLTATQQAQVDAVFFNIMSYHGVRDRLTDDQMDLVTDTSNSSRAHVASGTTWFVDVNGNPGFEFGTSSNPFRDVDDALNAASAGDIVLLRAGTYSRPASATATTVTLRSTRGAATVL